MSKTKNHRKLRKRRGGDPDDPATATGQTQPAAPGLGQPAAPGLGQPAAPVPQPQPQDQKEPSGFDMSPPPLTQPVPRPLPGQAPVQAQTPVVEPPPTPSFWEKLTSHFKKKPESPSETTQPTGLFSSNTNISFFDPRTWFKGGKTKRHGKKTKKVKAKKSKSKKH